tara:strand:+ start:8235 stop:8432 length:198 start_codon:yes stop_codon:yes gene_type:complete
MNNREFIIRLKQEKSHKVQEHLVRKSTFAEAATEAYRFLQDLQFGMTHTGVWRIESIVEVDFMGF